jgi:hypothetical protein
MSHAIRRTVVLAMVLANICVLQAAPLDKSLSETDGRKKAAENGLRQIKMKSQQEAEQVRGLYTAAASNNNAWVDMLCQAIEHGAPAAPDVSTVAGSAASSLVEWVSARNRALGLPELTGPVGESVRKTVVQDLTDIASSAWRDSRSDNADKRKRAAATLGERLRWKPFEEIK